MSDTLEKVQAIVVEHLGVEKDKVTDTASFIDDLGAGYRKHMERRLLHKSSAGNEC